MENESTMLKVVSILMIIGSVISIIAAISNFGIIGNAHATDGVSAGLIVFLWITLLFSVLGSAFKIIAGIIGVQASSGTENIDLCMSLAYILVIIDIVLMVLSIIFNVFNHSSEGIISAILELLLPVLYFVGAKEVSQIRYII